MKVFRVKCATVEKFYGTKAEAKQYIRTLSPALRDETLVTEIDVQTDKVGIVSMLNGAPLFIGGQVWGVTRRGALTGEPD